jgi:hypothetical protein
VPARLRPLGTPRTGPELRPAGLGARAASLGARAASLRPRGAEWPLVAVWPLVAPGPVVAVRPLVPPGPVVAVRALVAPRALALRRTGVPAWLAVADLAASAEVALAAIPSLGRRAAGGPAVA